MSHTPLESAYLPNGLSIKPGVSIAVRERVAFDNTVFYPGEIFSVHSLELDPDENEILLHLDDAPLDILEWGTKEANGFVGLIEKGKFVVVEGQEPEL